MTTTILMNSTLTLSFVADLQTTSILIDSLSTLSQLEGTVVFSDAPPETAILNEPTTSIHATNGADGHLLRTKFCLFFLSLFVIRML
jgi:hypothetical protein